VRERLARRGRGILAHCAGTHARTNGQGLTGRASSHQLARPTREFFCATEDEGVFDVIGDLPRLSGRATELSVQYFIEFGAQNLQLRGELGVGSYSFCLGELARRSWPSRRAKGLKSREGFCSPLRFVGSQLRSTTVATRNDANSLLAPTPYLQWATPRRQIDDPDEGSRHFRRRIGVAT